MNVIKTFFAPKSPELSSTYKPASFLAAPKEKSQANTSLQEFQKSWKSWKKNSLEAITFDLRLALNEVQSALGVDLPALNSSSSEKIAELVKDLEKRVEFLEQPANSAFGKVQMNQQALDELSGLLAKNAQLIPSLSTVEQTLLKNLESSLADLGPASSGVGGALQLREIIGALRDFSQTLVFEEALPAPLQVDPLQSEPIQSSDNSAELKEIMEPLAWRMNPTVFSSIPSPLNFLEDHPEETLKEEEQEPTAEPKSQEAPKAPKPVSPERATTTEAKESVQDLINNILGRPPGTSLNQDTLAGINGKSEEVTPEKVEPTAIPLKQQLNPNQTRFLKNLLTGNPDAKFLTYKKVDSQRTADLAATYALLMVLSEKDEFAMIKTSFPSFFGLDATGAEHRSAISLLTHYFKELNFDPEHTLPSIATHVKELYPDKRAFMYSFVQQKLGNRSAISLKILSPSSLSKIGVLAPKLANSLQKVLADLKSPKA